MLEKPYCCKEDVYKITRSSDQELNEWYESCITVASRMVDDFCYRDFWFHDYSVDGFLLGEEDVVDDIISLPFPVITLDKITSVIMNDPETESDTVEPLDYRYRVGERIVTHKTTFANGVTAWTKDQDVDKYDVRAYGTFGYALDTLDPDNTPPPTIPVCVRRATAMIAASLSEENRKETIGFDGVRQELIDNRIPREAKMLLSRYKLESRVVL